MNNLCNGDFTPTIAREPLFVEAKAVQDVPHCLVYLLLLR
jgi:hypothetical protein